MNFTRCLGVLAAVGMAASPAVGQDRSIEVDVAIATEAGAPVSGIPVAVYVASIEDEWFGTTDANGLVELTCDVPSDATKGYVSVTVAAAGHDAQTFQEVRAAARTAKQRIDEHFYPNYFEFSLDAQTDHYSVQVVARDAVAISGRIVDAHGAGQVAAAVVLRGSHSFGVGQREAPAGAFILPGVEKDAPAELFVFSTDGSVVETVTVSGTQTSTDLDLGDIVVDRLSDLNGDATVSLVATHQQAVAEIMEPTDHSVTLISDDAETILVFPTDRNGSVQRNTTSASGSIAIPAGRYFVAPGSIWGRCGTRLLDLIRAGNVDLEGAGVPTVQATSAATVSRSINMAEAKEAILSAN